MSSTAPVSTGFPAYMTMMSSAIPATTPRSWVIMTTAAPVSSWAVWSTSRTWAWMVTSRAVVGSSATRTRGLLAMAMAIMTRWRMPPENSCGKAFSLSLGLGIPTMARSSTARASLAVLLMVGWWMVSASMIWVPTVNTGVRDDNGSWKTMARSLPRYLHMALSLSPSNSRP